MKVLVENRALLLRKGEINGLSQMQKTVGGLIQAIYPFEE